MSLIYLITALLIILYLIYPLWLTLYSSSQSEGEIETVEINSVSLILLSYNGQQYLSEKINFLMKELSCFQNHELIIIDDNSTDGSKKILDNFRNIKNIRIVLKDEHKGIPHSMNMEQTIYMLVNCGILGIILKVDLTKSVFIIAL